MKNAIFAALLAAVFLLTTVGCKSGPQIKPEPKDQTAGAKKSKNSSSDEKKMDPKKTEGSHEHRRGGKYNPNCKSYLGHPCICDVQVGEPCVCPK